MNTTLFNVFDGPSAYLDPRNHGPVPLVKLPPELVSFPAKDRVVMYAQRADCWPLRSLKHPAVFHMLFEALRQGLLEGVHTISESSSGNTAYCLAMLAKMLGKKVALYFPSDIATTKEARLRNMGIEMELVKCYDRAGELSAMEQARNRGQEPGCFYLGQYSNEHNVAGHVQYHMKPVWQQTNESMRVYACGLGTCGTVTAARTFFGPEVAVVAARCAPKDPIPGIRSLAQLQDVPLFKNERLQCADIYAEEILQEDAYISSAELAVAGLNVGPTSGAAQVALEKFLMQEKELDTWDRLRNEEGEIVCVFMCGDSKDLYDDEKYRTHLASHQIPVWQASSPSDYTI